MNYSLLSEQECHTTIGGVTIYIDSYEIAAEKKFLFQPMASAGIEFSELGRHPAILKINGKVLKSDGVNPAVKFNTDMTNNIQYFITIDDVYFNAVRLKRFHTVNETNSEFISCQFEFYCDSYISGGDE